jgi:excisionase family DNA binding protein
MIENESLIITIPSAAKMLGISRGLAYQLARQDKLPIPTIRLGRRMVLSRKAVENLLSGNSKSGSSNG